MKILPRTHANNADRLFSQSKRECLLFAFRRQILWRLGIFSFFPPDLKQENYRFFSFFSVF